MRVKLLVSRGGINFTQSAGEEIEVSPTEGKAMIEAGQAEEVSSKAQTATRSKSEKAIKPSPEKR